MSERGKCSFVFGRLMMTEKRSGRGKAQRRVSSRTFLGVVVVVLQHTTLLDPNKRIVSLADISIFKTPLSGVR
jgi:hypothetical protein